MTVVGIDVSKGKSMVAAMKPGGELVAAPYEVRHSDIELSHLALDVLCMEPDTRVVMEATGRYVKCKPENEAVYQFYAKKRDEGKPFFVCTTAAANKFLRIYYARVKECLNATESATQVEEG